MAYARIDSNSISKKLKRLFLLRFNDRRLLILSIDINVHIIWDIYLYWYVLYIFIYMYIFVSFTFSLFLSLQRSLTNCDARIVSISDIIYSFIFCILRTSCRLGFGSGSDFCFGLFLFGSTIIYLLHSTLYFLFMAGDKYRWHQSLAGNQLLVGSRFPPASRPPCENRCWSPVDQAT